MVPVETIRHVAVAALVAMTFGFASHAKAAEFIQSFFVIGPGTVTYASGSGPDVPPVGLRTQLVGYLQLYDPLTVGLPPDASGVFNFDRSQGILAVDV